MALSKSKDTLKAPEGTYKLISERRTNHTSFKAERLPKLALAEAQNIRILHAVADVVEVCDYGDCEKSALRHICAQPATWPTCVAYYPAADGYDTLIGLNSGDVVVVKLSAQMEAPIQNSRPISHIVFSAEAAGDNSRLVSVAWIPSSRGCTFLAAHASGAVFVYPKGMANSAEGNGRGSRGSLGRPPATEIRVPGGVTAAAVSPDGACIATAGVDGAMRIYSISGGPPTAGFKSYYGGLLCLAWSQDGRYIATGGEDDLVSLYGLIEQSVVVWGEGHMSWVAAVAFDDKLNQIQPQQGQVRALRTLSGNPCSSEDAVYRLGSIGQDGQLLLWDISVPSVDYQLSPSSLVSRSSRQDPASPGRGGPTASPSSARSSGPPETNLDGLSSARSQPGILPAVPHAEMTFCSPATGQRVSDEPLSDLLFTMHAIFVTDQVGAMRCWKRPSLPASPQPSPERRTAASSAEPVHVQKISAH